MKHILLAAILLGSSMSFAADATCPQGSTRALLCKSTPKAGDHELAIAMLQTVAICKQNADILMVLQSEDKVESAPASVVSRPGGTQYAIKTSEIDFSMEVVSGIRSSQLPGKLTVKIHDADFVVSSSYTCAK